ncbi:hypothetical protein I203_103488 [Kwoniella mangroviensis CBS 8507]|uniref:uncharacterized protein n=1 Tax=Kwoniella mangroviensis CBS 8507 TaxID=1296122 RepID=UPI00080D484C|nr:uncharacterized protein I203_06191 [Kwoniella mangroviensis CBS 8507]OCF64945.1 hypothetical protein I203_06191 [Kwoniella mangroviensis CBS 8507]
MAPRLPAALLHPRALAGPSRPTRRALSTVSQTSPSPKISSVPFKIRPEDAAQRMYINGLLASAALPNMILAGLLRLFGPSITPLANEFGLGSNLKMKDMKAVLYPIWRVDSILQASVKLEGTDQRVEPKMWISTREGYVPGNPFAPLSYLSFAVPPLPDDLPQYNLSEDLTQLGDGFDVVPVPFTVSPLGLASKLRKLIGTMKQWENVTIDESKWEEIMLAAYPIMFPIYIAEFEHDMGDDGIRSFNVIMDAHDENPTNCRVSWPPPPQLVESGRFDKNYFVNPAPFLPMANLLLYPSVAPHNVIGPNTSKLVESFREWMSPAPYEDDKKNIPPSPMLAVQNDEEPNGPNWDDVRIQSWSGEERLQNGDWIEQALKTQKGIETLETMSYFSSRAPHPEDLKGLVINTAGSRPTFERKSLSDMENQLRDDVERMKKELEEMKPEWLREFDKHKNKS